MCKIIDFAKAKERIGKSVKKKEKSTTHSSIITDWYRFQELSEDRKKEVNSEIEKMYQQGYSSEDKWYKNTKSEYDEDDKE